MGKVITIASGKGGTGKTTSVAALSSCLALLNHKTLCIDFDFRLKNLDLSLGIKELTMADIMDVSGRHVDLMDACIEHKGIKGLYYLNVPSYLGSVDVDLESLGNVFNEIRDKFDFCLLDTPAGIGDGFRMAHTFTDMSIIVATGEIPSIRNAQRTSFASNLFGVKEKRLLINRVNKKDFKWLRQTIDDMINKIGLQLIGVIQEDKSVFKAVHSGCPLLLYKQNHAAYEYMDTALRITGKQVPLRLY